MRKLPHNIIVSVNNQLQWGSVNRDLKIFLFLLDLQCLHHFPFISFNCQRESEPVWFTFLNNLKRDGLHSMDNSNPLVFYFNFRHAFPLKPLTEEPLKVFTRSFFECRSDVSP